MISTAGLAENLAAAEAHLARFATQPTCHLIAGEAAPSVSGATFTNHSPIDGSTLGEVAAGDAADVAAAAHAAARAFKTWSAVPGIERREILHRVADLIVERAQQIAVTECADTGQTIRFMRAAALRGAENFRFFADRAPGAADGLALPSAHHVNYTTRHPIGPVA